MELEIKLGNINNLKRYKSKI